jgi:hypothetical protein
MSRNGEADGKAKASTMTFLRPPSCMQPWCEAARLGGYRRVRTESCVFQG